MLKNSLRIKRLVFIVLAILAAAYCVLYFKLESFREYSGLGGHAVPLGAPTGNQ